MGMDEKKESLIKLYRENVRNVYRFFYKRTFNKEVSEDLTSSVFIKFTEIYSTQDNEIDEPRRYLYGIVKNTFMDHLRERYKGNSISITEEMIESFLTETEENTRDYAYSLELRLKQLLPSVPEKQREILTMRFIDKMSLKEICKVLGKDMNHVKTTQRRGLRKLQELSECTPDTTNILGG